MKKIIAIVGARPQFIKHAPVELAFKDHLELVCIHTGQHYDKNMSEIFFTQLGMTEPKYMLSVGSHSHGVQTGKMMIEIEPIVQEEKPDAILVYGDTNSTLAGALVGAKLHIPVIHLEAGLRSFNKEMPEEVNRILTDHVSALLLVPTLQGIRNLEREGITEHVYQTGDVMCDMIRITQNQGIIKESPEKGKYYYSTIHRPYNTDDKDRLRQLLEAFQGMDFPVRFAIHPRTRNRIRQMGLDETQYDNIQFLDPLSYFENIQQQANARGVITDSGGIQKEAYLLEVPCITIRPETEWLETLENDWNVLAYDRLSELREIASRTPGDYNPDVYGDGKGAIEIRKIIQRFFDDISEPVAHA